MTGRVRLELASPAAELILDNPGRHNALSQEMWRVIPSLLKQAIDSTAAKVILIHGGTSGHFAAGADISEFEDTYATPESTLAASKVISDALDAIETCPKPVIAAIEGNCIGGGVSVALAADIRIASETSQFGITPARLGLLYPASDTRRLLHAVGSGAAKDLLFTGRILPADEARKLRLVDRLAPNGMALDHARDLAKDIADRSQWTVRATKRIIRGLSTGWAEDGPETRDMTIEGFSNPDFKEGVRAFLEKRKPDFPID